MSKAGSPDEIKPERKIPCGCIVLAVFIGVPVGFVLLALLMIVGRDSAAKRRVRDQVAALKAAGKPVDDASLQTFYHENTTDENVQRWLELIALIENASFYVDGKELGPWSEKFSGIPVEGDWPKETESREFRARKSQVIDELKTLAMQRKKVRFPIKFESFNTLLPSVQSSRSLQRLLSFETKIAMRDRDSKKTREGLSAMFGVSVAIEGSPSLVSDLVVIALMGMATAELQTALENDLLNENDLKQLLNEIQARRSLDGEWKQSVSSERAMGLAIFTDPKMGKSLGVPAVPFRSNDALSYLQAMADFEEVSTENLDGFLSGTKIAAENLEDKFRSIMRIDTLFTAQIFPAMQQAAVAVVEKEMRCRMAELAIGIRLYKIKHGTFPTDLNALTDVGLNPNKLAPIGGKPFGYRIEDGRAILWGFSHRLAAETPDQPPEIPADTYNPDNAVLRNEWKWELR